MPPPAREPAVTLLLASARADLGVASREELAEAAARVSDWARVEALVAYHGLNPLAHRWWGSDPDIPVPEDVRQRVVERFRTQTFRALAYIGELLRLLARFREQGIPVLTFKGPVLAQQAYGHPALRAFCDLDLLVRRAAVPAAAELLRAEGYVPHYPLTAEQLSRFRAVDFELGWRHPGREVAVDLHWGLAPVQYASVLPEEEAWRDPVDISLAHHPVPTLATRTLVWFLFLHHSKHDWASFDWLNDLARLLRGYDAPAWDQLLQDARARRTCRMVRLGCHLLQRLLAFPLPGPVSAFVREDPAVPGLGDAVEAELWDTRPRRPGARVYRASMDTTADVWRYWRECIFTPRPEDWLLLELPRPCHFLYGPLRLARLAAKRTPHLRRFTAAGRTAPAG